MFEQKFLDLLNIEFQKVDNTLIKVGRDKNRIFLCGAKGSGRVNEPESVRDYFLKHADDSQYFKDVELILAETIFQKFIERDLFKSLVELETSISSFCSSVLIILESAGSIAELGAFCMVEPIKKKLVVLIQQKHFDENSYIKNGPLGELEEHQVTSLDWADWSPYDEGKAFHSSLKTLSPIFTEHSLKQVQKVADIGMRSFQDDDLYHLSSLVGWLCQTMFPLQLTEAKTIMGFFGVNTTQPQLSRALKMGQLFGTLQRIDIGGNKYIYPMDDNEVVEVQGEIANVL